MAGVYRHRFCPFFSMGVFLSQALTRLRFFSFLLLFAFLLAVLAPPVASQSQPAWKQQWDKIVIGGKREGKVVVFGPAGETIRTVLIASFKKSFPEIALEYVGGRATEQAARITAERDGGVYSVDVFIGGAVTMMELGSSAALERIEQALILPEVKDPNYWLD
jgi:ABC-type glycerol-3-phosphate transport system substrate-binding protein